MKSSTSQLDYLIDEDDPRAPSQDEWDRMTERQRRRVVSNLPSEFSAEAMPPEGDFHHDATDSIRDTLRSYFRRIRAGIYVGSNLAVYYPQERVFAPDIIAVTGVDPHPRQSWVVSDEGKGLDVAFEIHFLGNAPKDLRANVTRYARLGITEYFVFDARKKMLLGYRLPSDRQGAYRSITAHRLTLQSEVLGLELAVVGDRVRFYHGGAMLPDHDEMITRLDGMVDSLMLRAQDEARRADLAEQQLAEALAELRRLKGD